MTLTAEGGEIPSNAYVGRREVKHVEEKVCVC